MGKNSMEMMLGNGQTAKDFSIKAYANYNHELCLYDSAWDVAFDVTELSEINHLIT